MEVQGQFSRSSEEPAGSVSVVGSSTWRLVEKNMWEPLASSHMAKGQCGGSGGSDVREKCKKSQRLDLEKTYPCFCQCQSITREENTK